MNIDPSTITITEMALNVPGAEAAFDRLCIDHHCRGGRTLATACVEAEIAVEELLEIIEREARTPGSAR